MGLKRTNWEILLCNDQFKKVLKNIYQSPTLWFVNELIVNSYDIPHYVMIMAMHNYSTRS